MPGCCRESQKTSFALSAAMGRWYVLLGAAFAATHAVYYTCGVRFDRTTLIEVMHFLDPELLRSRLLESLWHLHIQPPLMNLAVGLALKITPESPWLFQGVFLLLGFVLCACAFRLQARLGVRPWLAFGLTVLFMASPGFILWEHYLFYMLPVAALLALAATLLDIAARRQSAWPVALFFLCLFLVCGLWSMFHFIYFVLVLGAVLLWRKEWRRRALWAGLPLLLVLLCFYAKNWMLFGEFTVSTFSPKNLWIMTAGNLGGEEKGRLVAAGKLSPFSLINRWSHLEAYPEEYGMAPERFAASPALAHPHKSNGAVNYNHYGRIAIAKVYGRDARYALLHRPGAYLNACAQSAARYFLPASALPVSPQNQQHMQPAICFYDRVLAGRLPDALAARCALAQRTGHPPRLGMLIGLPAAWLFGVWRLWRSRRDGPRSALLAFMLFHIAMVAALGCALDFLETARYRFVTDAFYLVLLGMMCETACAWLMREKGETADAQDFSAIIR